MSELITPHVEIRSYSQEYPDGGIRYYYTNNVSDGRRHSGTADLMINRVRAYRDELRVYDSSPVSFHELIEAGLKQEDFLAHLITFYPNGDIPEEGSTRKEVGSMVFQRLIEDSLRHGAESMFVYTASPSMQSFLAEKHAFTRFGGKGYHPDTRWYKWLQ